MVFKRYLKSAIAVRITFFALSATVGATVSAATLALMQMIAFVQWIFYGYASEEKFATIAAENGFLVILLAPAIGGILVGLLTYLMHGKRYHGIADVMEVCALRGGRMDVRSGITAAVAAAISMGSGAPVGREGPAVHIGASISAWLAEKFNFSHSDTLTLLGCGAAAAVTASFNAPIAGVLFALEVVVGYYTLRVFAPVVMASVGSVIVRQSIYGSQPTFHLPEFALNSLWELPTFLVLGALCAGFVLFMIFLIGKLQLAWQKIKAPIWCQAGVAGLIIGAIATQYPHILSVGYQAIDMALHESILPVALFSLLWLKLFGTVLALGSGFAGGVFSPSLFFGAMLGGVYWYVLSHIFPDALSSQSVYSIAGMAGLASAMLGAPISTVIIVFELTFNYQITIAVMLTAAMASTMMQISPHTSYFRWQLSKRGIDITDGRDQSLLLSKTIDFLIIKEFSLINVEDGILNVQQQLIEEEHTVAIALDDSGGLIGSTGVRKLMIGSVNLGFEHPVLDMLYPSDIKIPTHTNIVAALQAMADHGLDYIPVVEFTEGEDHVFVGIVYKDDLLRTYYETMRSARNEEFGVN